MTDDKDRIAALERDNAELKNDLAALKAKVDPPKSTFKPMTDANIATGSTKCKSVECRWPLHHR